MSTPLYKKEWRKEEEKVTGEMWRMTRDTCQLTCDMRWEVNILSKFQLPTYYGLGVKPFWRFWGKGSPTDWLNNKWGKKVFLEQPWIRVPFKKKIISLVGDHCLWLEAGEPEVATRAEGRDSWRLQRLQGRIRTDICQKIWLNVRSIPFVCILRLLCICWVI